MGYGNLTQLAEQWVAEQGDDASEHLAEAIRELRAVGDEKGAKLLTRIARTIDLLDGGTAPAVRRRQVIRRPRDGGFGPSS